MAARRQRHFIDERCPWCVKHVPAQGRTSTNICPAEVGHDVGKLEPGGAEGDGLGQNASCKLLRELITRRKGWFFLTVVFCYPVWIEKTWSCAFNIFPPESSSLISLQILRFLIFCAQEHRTYPELSGFLCCVQLRIGFYFQESGATPGLSTSSTYPAFSETGRFVDFSKFTPESGRTISSPFPLCLEFS